MARTPFGKFGGALRDITIPGLAAPALRAAIDRASVSADEIDELILGVNFPGADRSIARQAGLQAGLPDTQVAYTIDRACCSSMAAIGLGTRALLAGEADLVLAGGADNLSRVPRFEQASRWGQRLGDVILKDQLVVSCPHTGVPRAIQAAREAALFGVGRSEQDEWALRSQELCAKAMDRHLFDDEIVAVTGSDGVAIKSDECPRPSTSAVQLASLPTVNGSDTVTAGNAPALGTGAAVVLLARPLVAERRDLPVIASVVATARVAGHPDKIASVPAVAAELALKRAGVSLSDISLVEINEAFAAVPLVTTLMLADGDPAQAASLRARTNVNGGAIALGHPTGASGARIVMTLALELNRRGGGLGLVAICGGVGEAEAAIISVGA
jgi:acetyl-CoA C-acetyltransferase